MCDCNMYGFVSKDNLYLLRNLLSLLIYVNVSLCNNIPIHPTHDIIIRCTINKNLTFDMYHL